MPTHSSSAKGPRFMRQICFHEIGTIRQFLTEKKTLSPLLKECLLDAEGLRQEKDLCGRILKAEALQERVRQSFQEYEDKSAPLMQIAYICAFAIVATSLGVFIPLVATSPVLGFASILPFFAGALASLHFASFHDGLSGPSPASKALREAAELCDNTIKDAHQSPDILSLARAPDFNGIMQRNPKIKEAFVLASARQAVVDGTALPVLDLSKIKNSP